MAATPQVRRMGTTNSIGMPGDVSIFGGTSNLGGTMGATPTVAKREGPYDFAWLLERIADFGSEVPPWHTGGSMPSDFRSDPPPPPLQLLIPEAVAFDPPDKRQHTMPRALFFTDRAGYLRGHRRALTQGSQVCQGLLRLMRHRQPAVTLTHSSGVAFEHHSLFSGAKAWTDRTFQYTGIPKEMEGAVFFAGPHSSVPTGELLLSAPEGGTAYIWSEDRTESDGGLPGLGWEAVAGSMSFGSGRTMRIFKKLLTGGTSLVIPVNYMWLGGVGFQPFDPSDLEPRRSDASNPQNLGSLGSTGATSPLGSLVHTRTGSGQVPGAAGLPAAGLGAPGAAGAAGAPGAGASGAGAGGGASPEGEAAEVGALSVSAEARRRKARVIRRHTFIDQKGTDDCGAWKVVSYNGPSGPVPSKTLSNSDVAGFFGLTADGRATPWPLGAKLLLACFWLDRRRRGGGSEQQSKVYRYDALQGEATPSHPGLSHNIVNHFERYSFLDKVADHNLMSSAPIQISQHLSYHCALELLSGDFEFVRDGRGQLWLVDARNLFFIPAARRAGAGGGGGGGGQSEKRETRSQKLPRYLSEEALHNLKLSEDTGDKCQHMMELMAEHYRSVKDSSGMDELLRQTDEVMEITVPMLEGTDRRAFARTFGITKERPHEADINTGLAAASEVRRQPKLPSARGLGAGTGRTLGAGARLMPAGAGKRPPLSAREHGSKRPSSSPSAPFSSSNVPPWARPSAAAAAAAALAAATPRAGPRGGAESPSPMTRLPSQSSAWSPGGRSVAGKGQNRMTRWRTRAFGDEDATGQNASEEVPTVNVEIVLPESAQKLLHFSGPGVRPDGPTLDIVGPPATRQPGAGLRDRRRTGRPQVTAVEVPRGGSAKAPGRRPSLSSSAAAAAAAAAAAFGRAPGGAEGEGG